jgi:hypothetical protein
MNRAAEAKTLLFPVILASGQPDQFDATLLIEARYLLGLAMSVEAFGNQRLPGLDECPIFANTATWTIAHTLAWFTETAAQPAPADAKAAARLPETIEILRHYGQNSEEILLRGTAQAAPCRELVEKIAALGKLQIVWSPQAPARLEERTAHLALDGVPLMDVLHALLNQHGLYWQIGEDALQIATEAETDKETVKTLRANVARQALRQALFAGSDRLPGTGQR